MLVVQQTQGVKKFGDAWVFRVVERLKENLPDPRARFGVLEGVAQESRVTSDDVKDFLCGELHSNGVVTQKVRPHFVVRIGLEQVDGRFGETLGVGHGFVRPHSRLPQIARERFPTTCPTGGRE